MPYEDFRGTVDFQDFDFADYSSEFGYGDFQDFENPFFVNKNYNFQQQHTRRYPPAGFYTGSEYWAEDTDSYLASPPVLESQSSNSSCSSDINMTINSDSNSSSEKEKASSSRSTFVPPVVPPIRVTPDAVQPPTAKLPPGVFARPTLKRGASVVGRDEGFSYVSPSLDQAEDEEFKVGSPLKMELAFSDPAYAETTTAGGGGGGLKSVKSPTNGHTKALPQLSELAHSLSAMSVVIESSSSSLGHLQQRNNLPSPAPRRSSFVKEENSQPTVAVDMRHALRNPTWVLTSPAGPSPLNRTLSTGLASELVRERGSYWEDEGGRESGQVFTFDEDDDCELVFVEDEKQAAAAAATSVNAAISPAPNTAAVKTTSTSVTDHTAVTRPNAADAVIIKSEPSSTRKSLRSHNLTTRHSFPDTEDTENRAAETHTRAVSADRRSRVRRSKKDNVNISLRALTDLPSDLYNRANDNTVTIGVYSKAVRRAKIVRWQNKKMRALTGESRPELYKCRKVFAGARPRVGGRFVKLDDDTHPNKVKKKPSKSAKKPTKKKSLQP